MADVFYAVDKQPYDKEPVAVEYVDKLLTGETLLTPTVTAIRTDKRSGLIALTVAAAARTYTRAMGSFLTDGLTVGASVLMSGFANAGNNGAKTIEDVSALVVTVTVGTGLVNETGDGDEEIAVDVTSLVTEGAAVSGTKAQFTRKGGTDGITYKATMRTATSLGNQYEADIYWKVTEK